MQKKIYLFCFDGKQNWKISSEQSFLHFFFLCKNGIKEEKPKNSAASSGLGPQNLSPLRVWSGANWEAVLKCWRPRMIQAAELSCLVTFLLYIIYSIDYSMAICLMEKKMENTWARLIGKKLDCFFFFFYWLGSTYFDGLINDLCCHATYIASRVD